MMSKSSGDIMREGIGAIAASLGISETAAVGVLALAGIGLYVLLYMGLDGRFTDG